MSTSLSPFSFGTKAETLERLSGLLTKCQVPPFYYFFVSGWRDDPDRIIGDLISNFGEDEVIVRSSALSEDGKNSAMAGAFLSVPSVFVDNRDMLTKAIESVISSYQIDNNGDNPKNQVLVQVMTRNVSMSGVLMTQDLNTGAPYYVINYDDESGRTDTVASGTGYCNRTLLVHRDSWRLLRSKRFLILLEAVEEIEKAIGSSFLDIEFALDKDDELFLFQVRQITTQGSWSPEIGVSINETLSHLKSIVSDRFKPLPGIRGSRSILGKMPDWNPAEMIGGTPRPLALSLYRYLITERAWRVARRQMGYAEPPGMPLMLSLGGQPFIDVRLSFHSYLPEGLPPAIGDKLVDAWLDCLEANPHLHDKVEFDVAATTLAFDFDARVSAQFPNVLEDKELKVFRNSLHRLTGDLIAGQVASVDSQLAKIEELTRKREALLEAHSKPSIALVSALLEDCVEFGIIPFSILARHAFIAKSFLQSLVNRNVLTDEDVACFHQSIPTVASDLIDDLERFFKEEISSDEFMKRYGHLRPGTYDILSFRYDSRKDLLDSPSNIHSLGEGRVPFELTDSQEQKISALLLEHGYSIGSGELINYFKAAIQGREYAKFIFTRNVSDSLEMIASWGDENGLGREELSYLGIHEILDSLAVSERQPFNQYFREMAEKGREEHQITNALRLPLLVSEPSDFVIVPLLVDQPNFITSKSIQGETLHLEGSDIDLAEIDNKIVLIESADPGFDWIFTHPIKGLITKFGGANSHMAIRCAEFGLPAAIGCGEQIFDRSTRSKMIEINCADGLILSLEG